MAIIRLRITVTHAHFIWGGRTCDQEISAVEHSTLVRNNTNCNVCLVQMWEVIILLNHRSSSHLVHS